MDELIIFLIRETGWSFEYTTQFVRKTPLRRLNAFVREMLFQREMEDYGRMLPFGVCLANIFTAFSKNRKYRPSDFVGNPPQRKETGLEEAAKKAGIILPEKKKED